MLRRGRGWEKSSTNHKGRGNMISFAQRTDKKRLGGSAARTAKEYIINLKKNRKDLSFWMFLGFKF